MFNTFKRWFDSAYAGLGKSRDARSSEWPKVRKAHLALQPACAVCGCTSGVEVHHIQPFHLHPDLELEPSNLITLGESCPTGNHHLLFGHLGSWRSFNASVIKDADYIRTKIQLRPMD